MHIKITSFFPQKISANKYDYYFTSDDISRLVVIFSLECVCGSGRVT